MDGMEIAHFGGGANGGEIWQNTDNQLSPIVNPYVKPQLISTSEALSSKVHTLPS